MQLLPLLSLPLPLPPPLPLSLPLPLPLLLLLPLLLPLPLPLLLRNGKFADRGPTRSAGCAPRALALCGCKKYLNAQKYPL